MAEITRTEVASTKHVTYGSWERADDVAPILRLSTFDGFPVLHFAYRRKVFETWRDGGQKVGRWVWEYR